MSSGNNVGSDDDEDVGRRVKATSLEKAAAAMFKERHGENAANAEEEDRELLVEVLEEFGGGSFLRGWRRQLDPDGNLWVNFPEFLAAAARMGYYGDTLSLFSQSDNLNVMTLSELAPYEGGLMTRFRRWVKAALGDPAELWRHLAAAAPSEDDVTVDIFSKECRRLGFGAPDEDFDLIFECIDVDGEGTVMQTELFFLEFDTDIRAQLLYKVKLGRLLQWRQQCSEEYIQHMQLKTQDGSRFHVAHRRAPRTWMERYFEQMPTVACHLKHQRAKDRATRAKQSKAKLITHMQRTYGHEVRAMRRAMHAAGGELRESNVRGYCARHGLSLYVQDMWKMMDGDRDGVVRLEEFAPQEALMLAKFHLWAKQRFGCCAAIWDTPEAATASRKLTGTWFREKSMQAATFREALRSLGWPDLGNPAVRKPVMNCLDLNGFGMIGREDLEWLDSWKPLEWVYADPDPAEWEKLKELLVRSYGHLLRAWRCLLDRDDSNTLSWMEFRDACRRVQFDGSAAAVWRHLDTDLSGTISMKEYDEESYHILDSFKEWAEVHFGSIQLCFKAVDEDQNGQISFKELKKACRKLRWVGDVRTLFDCLDIAKAVENGQRALELKEIVFLDTWQEAGGNDDDVCSQPTLEKPFRSTKTPKAFKEIADRLASPVNISKLGYSDWRSASQISLGTTGDVSRCESCPRRRRPRQIDDRLPSLDSSPYGEKLWGREISGMTRPPQRWRQKRVIEVPRSQSKVALDHGIDIHRDPTALAQFDGYRRAFSHPCLPRPRSAASETAAPVRPGSSPARQGAWTPPAPEPLFSLAEVLADANPAQA